LWVHHLPVTELQRVYDGTVKSSLDQTLATAKKYVQLDHAMLLLVGDRAKIEPGLRELGLGTIVILDDEGRAPGGGAGKSTATAR
jgi:hypothetical protein